MPKFFSVSNAEKAFSRALMHALKLRKAFLLPGEVMICWFVACFSSFHLSGELLGGGEPKPDDQCSLPFAGLLGDCEAS